MKRRRLIFMRSQWNFLGSPVLVLCPQILIVGVEEILLLNACLLAHHGRVAALVSRVAAGSTLKSEENGAAIRSPSKKVEYVGQDLILTVGMLSLENKGNFVILHSVRDSRQY